MDTFTNDIRSTYRYLPYPFKEFNETNGKQIYDEIMNKTMVESFENKFEKDPNYFKSVLLLHLSKDTRELIAFLEDHKTFITKCGHMTTDDHRMIIEILFYHGFCTNKIHHSNQFQLYSLLLEFLNINYEELDLQFDWKPVYNTIFAVTAKKKLHAILQTFSDNHGNIYNKFEEICYKLK